MRESGRDGRLLQRCADELIVMRASSQVAWQVIDGEAILVDLASGKTLGLNATATWLWSHLDGRSPNELAEGLSSAFDVSRDDAENDVRDFLRLLEERNLVSES